ncbi:VOC family protein [Aquihabitans sp. G128]|uniref:VOC family protein n=1 Tax=Aquihabitans sp. G128 TaxID=2849779 RepID=UPI001C22630B|nr:VOC family protein [Aquihabitans sp. G128]QXC60775.1 VOC family protein [Aquihabitans sp. G128]
MITNVSLITLWVTDQDEAKAFYLDKLGFVEHTDVQMGDGFRWCTIRHPDQPDLEVTLMVPGPPANPELAEAVRRSLAAGSMSGFGVTTTDCRGDHADLVAKGVEFVQPPSERPYGIEAVLRDNSGNWLVMVEPKEFTGEDFPHA